jgi:hypothetical protein
VRLAEQEDQLRSINLMTMVRGSEALSMGSPLKSAERAEPFPRIYVCPPGARLGRGSTVRPNNLNQPFASRVTCHLYDPLTGENQGEHG